MQEQMINGDSQSCYKIEQSTSYFVPKGILLMKIVSGEYLLIVYCFICALPVTM